MSQVGAECAIGRLLADGEFRRAFYRDPSATQVTESLDLTEHEVAALLRIKPARLEALAKRLDPRIVRAAVGRPRSPAVVVLPRHRAGQKPRAGGLRGHVVTHRGRSG